MKQCSTCMYYNALKNGTPPAGWCEFMISASVPFWMEKYITHIDKLGADVIATDGTECAAFVPDQAQNIHMENPND